MSNLFTYVAGGLMLVSFLYCFVFVSSKGNGIQNKAKRLLYETIPIGIKTAMRKSPGGEYIVWFLERAQSYVCYEANPAIMCMYVTLAVGGYYLFVVYGFVHIPNPYLASYHKYIAWPWMMTCYYSYYLACSTDPGFIKKGTDKKQIERAVKRYDYDDILFNPKSWCDTCEAPKPARSKHCTLCNMCCEKFDHHCVWINNCVGLHNYKYFMLFLIMHIGICVYACFLGLFCALHLIDEGDLWNKMFVNRQGQRFSADWKIVMQYLNRENEMFSIVIFLCGIVTVMLLGFVGFHSYLIWNNYTTNEFSRRQMCLRFIGQRAVFLQKWVDARDEGMKFKPAPSALEKYEQNGDLQVDMDTEDIRTALKLTKEQQESVNSGTHFKQATLKDALLQIWDPNTYDINGNSRPVDLKKPKDARTFSKKTSNWAYNPIDAEVREAEAAAEKAESEKKDE